MLPVNAEFVKDLISISRGNPRLFGTRVFERHKFIGKDEAFCQRLACPSGTETLNDVFKGMFPQF